MTSSHSEGQFIYPGGASEGYGPVGTARLANIRDAVEDVALMQAVRDAGGKKGEEALQAAIAKLVRTPTDHTDDAALLERTRRQIAALLL